MAKGSLSATLEVRLRGLGEEEMISLPPKDELDPRRELVVEPGVRFVAGGVGPR